VKKKIDKKTREQAALICAIAASTPAFNESYTMVLAAAITREAYDLAYAAWDAASSRIPYAHDGSANPIVDAEAEALLRTGWSPS